MAEHIIVTTVYCECFLHSKITRAIIWRQDRVWWRTVQYKQSEQLLLDGPSATPMTAFSTLLPSLLAYHPYTTFMITMSAVCSIDKHAHMTTALHCMPSMQKITTRFPRPSPFVFIYCKWSCSRPGKKVVKLYLWQVHRYCYLVLFLDTCRGIKQSDWSTKILALETQTE